jgi:hypothetical protein
MAVALIENSSRCPTNTDGERVVPGEVPWVVDLVEKVGALGGRTRLAAGSLHCTCSRASNICWNDARRCSVAAAVPCCIALVPGCGAECDRTPAPAFTCVPAHAACVPALQVAEVALNVEPYSYNPEAASKAANPNRRRKWLIPLVLAAQVGGPAADLSGSHHCSAAQNGLAFSARAGSRPEACVIHM